MRMPKMSARAGGEIDTQFLQADVASFRINFETAGRNKKPDRTGLTEPNRTVSFWNRPEPDVENEPNRTGPSHDASEKRRPNRVELENTIFRTEPNRNNEFSKSLEPNRIEPNRFLPAISFRDAESRGGEHFLPLNYMAKARITCTNRHTHI